MSNLPMDSQSTNALRRTRSTSDIQRPEPAYGPRHPLNPSDVDDHSPLRSVGIPPRYNLLQAPAASGRRSPPLGQLEYPQTRTLGGPTPHRNQNDNSASSGRDPATPRSIYRNLTLALGLGRGASRERRALVGLIFNLISGSSQIIIVTTILALSGTRFKSPQEPELTEWRACSRPLGPWACLWVIRAVIATSLNYWGFLRERHLLARRRSEQAGSVPINAENRRNLPPLHNEHVPTSPRAMENGRLTARDQVYLPNTLLYSRLTLFSSLLTLTWFLTAHILEYTSISTCRQSSPHIWWLVFGILCLMYLMVLEIVVLGFVVFVIAPILFLFWNIVLICIGRHPLQTHNTIKPEIGKLSKSIVESIPLVLYIPPPPDNIPQQQKPSVLKPDSIVAECPPEPKQRFRFIKHLTSFNSLKHGKILESKENKEAKKPHEPQTWEEHWEQGEYPFVVLEENRAACAICLLDFAEPKRIWGRMQSIDTKAEFNLNNASESNTLDVYDGHVQTTSNMVSGVISGSRNTETKLVDAGEGTQPLRLLACGHVFHKSCLDPWLLDISGRCPVCQRSVEVSKKKKPRKGQHDGDP